MELRIQNKKRINIRCAFRAMLVLLMFFTSCSEEKDEMDAFVSNLMKKMTIEEKIGQLNLQIAGDIVTGDAQSQNVLEETEKGNVGAIFNIKGVENIRKYQEVAINKSRLGIPLLVGMDVIHGYETMFPIPLALASSWDTLAVKDVARISAKEASADGINWVFSPMVDIAPDPRWGRMAEGSGEDPYLASKMGAAMVRGYQGDLTSNENVLSCVKHYALYGAVESGRDYSHVDMSRQKMFNVYLPPYKAAIDAGAGSLMTSFNVIDGIPSTANELMLNDVLRKKWEYKGFVVSDFLAIAELINYRVAKDRKECGVRALRATTDMDMASNVYVETLKEALREGVISEKHIDAACRRILEAKYKLGLFDDPFKYCDTTRRETDIFTAEHRKRAREIATETFVLLKNDNDILPLKKKGKIALIGPLADTRTNMSGCWSLAATNDCYPSLKESMQKALGKNAKLLYAQGCNLMSDSIMQRDAQMWKVIPRVNTQRAKQEAMQIAREADVIVCAMGECAEMSGECSSRADLSLPDEQMSLLQELATLKKPIVLLNFSGRATIMKWEAEHIPAIMNVWFGGSEAGDAICDVLFGDVSPSGKLTVTMPQCMGQLPLNYGSASNRPVPEGEKRFRKFESNYLDVRNDPLFPFGYGLSYTKFDYSDLKLSSEYIKKDKDDNVTVSVKVSNIGKVTATEIVQLYICCNYATLARPSKELRKFRRIEIPAGEERIVDFTLTTNDLRYYIYDDIRGYQKKLQLGTFTIMVGPNSRDLLSAELEVK